MAQLEGAGYPARSEEFKRTPAGYADLDPARERLLRFAALWTSIEAPIGDWFYQGEAVEWALGHWQKMAPPHRWLVTALPH
mgnify:CR=1 FL=1